MSTVAIGFGSWSVTELWMCLEKIPGRVLGSFHGSERERDVVPAEPERIAHHGSTFAARATFGT